MDILEKTLEDALRELRGDSSQAEMAAVLGTISQSVSNWERGRGRPSTPFLARYLGLAREKNRPEIAELLYEQMRSSMGLDADADVPLEASGRSKIEVFIDREDWQRLQELAIARGFKSANQLAAHIIEREVCGESLNMDSLSPDEAEIARAVVELYRNPDPKHPIATLFAGFFTFLKNQVAQKKLTTL